MFGVVFFREKSRVLDLSIYSISTSIYSISTNYSTYYYSSIYRSIDVFRDADSNAVTL